MTAGPHREDRSANANGTGRQLRTLLTQTIAGLSVKPPYALLDYPDEPSAGEGAAWLGTLACLKAATAARPAYVAKRSNVDWKRIAGLSGDVLVFGRSTPGVDDPSLGDFRREVLKAAAGRRIIQLPATVASRDEGRAWADACAHQSSKLTVLLSERSKSTRLVGPCCEELMVPPMIVGLHLPARAPAGSGAIDLRQTDHAENRPAGDPLGTWLEEPQGLHRRFALQALLRAGPNRDRQRFWLYFLMSQSRLMRGVALLRSAQDVVTDRLDAYLLGLVLDARVRPSSPAPDIAEFASTWSTGSFSAAAASGGDAQ